MYSIDEIIEMLVWNNDEETQRKGRELAGRLKCLDVLFQPSYPENCKTVWENCANVISEKTDKELSRYTTKMLEWLIDLNWPGADIILERLKNFKEVDSLCFSVRECVKRASLTDEEFWLDYMSELLDNDLLKAKLPDDTLQILEKHYHYWEKDDEADKEAASTADLCDHNDYHRKLKYILSMAEGYIEDLVFKVLNDDKIHPDFSAVGVSNGIKSLICVKQCNNIEYDYTDQTSFILSKCFTLEEANEFESLRAKESEYYEGVQF